jgi:hypothetical protein
MDNPLGALSATYVCPAAIFLARDYWHFFWPLWW